MPRRVGTAMALTLVGCVCLLFSGIVWADRPGCRLTERPLGQSLQSAPRTRPQTGLEEAAWRREPALKDYRGCTADPSQSVTHRSNGQNLKGNGHPDALPKDFGGGAPSGAMRLVDERAGGPRHPSTQSGLPTGARGAALGSTAPSGDAPLLLAEACSDQEALGRLKVGLPVAAVESLLGPPERISTSSDGQPRAATGGGARSVDWVWEYPDKGLTLVLGTRVRGGERGILSIAAGPDCRLRTCRGIGIGSSRAEVDAAYAGHPGIDAIAGFMSIPYQDQTLNLSFNAVAQDGTEVFRVERMTLSANIDYPGAEED